MPRVTDSKHTKELTFDATRRNEKSPSSVSLGLDRTSVGHFARTKETGCKSGGQKPLAGAWSQGNSMQLCSARWLASGQRWLCPYYIVSTPRAWQRLGEISTAVKPSFFFYFFKKAEFTCSPACSRPLTRNFETGSQCWPNLDAGLLARGNPRSLPVKAFPQWAWHQPNVTEARGSQRCEYNLKFVWFFTFPYRHIFPLPFSLIPLILKKFHTAKHVHWIQQLLLPLCFSIVSVTGRQASSLAWADHA